MNLMSMITVLTSAINMMLLMFIVAMIAACFFGRNIVISNKLLFAGLGIVTISFLFGMLSNPFLRILNPDLYEGLMKDPFNREWITQYNQYAARGNTIFVIVMYIYVFLFFLISYQEKRIRRAIETFICFYVTTLFTANITYYEYLYWTGGEWKTSVSYHSMSGAPYQDWVIINTGVSFLFYLILASVMYFGFYRRKVCYNIKLRYKILFVVWIIVFITIPEIPFESQVDDLAERYRYLCYIMGVFVPLLGVVAPIMLVMGTSAKSLKEKNDAQARYLAAELEYIERYKNAQTQTRAFRHDIVNNLQLATMLLDQGKTQEASAHLQEMLGKVQKLSPQYVTGDEMLDCIVSMKAERMESQGINFTADGVADGGLHMKPMDTCSIFANALDNAIEAAAQTERPKIMLNIKRTEKFFVINIENSAPKKVDLEKLFSGGGFTTKKDKESHGFGLRNIQKAVEENEGILQAKSGEDTFALSIMIPRAS